MKSNNGRKGKVIVFIVAISIVFLFLVKGLRDNDCRAEIHNDGNTLNNSEYCVDLTRFPPKFSISGEQ